MWLSAVAGGAQSGSELEAIRARATAGDLEAQNTMGNAYTTGQFGLKPDFGAALKWYEQAGERGYAPAQFNLGLAYDLGRGVAVDEGRALSYYLKSAEQGYAPAQYNAGNMYSSGRGTGQDYFEANLWFKQAADNGIIEAQFNLGLVYEAGHGVKKDDARAARWYQLAADRGYARAQYNLGLLYEDGRGVAKDATAAVVLYQAAAKQGLASAQINYGLALAEGRPGLPQDPVQAYVWLSRAVQNGAKPDARDALAKSLTPQQLSAAQSQLGGTVAAVPAPSRPTQTAANPDAGKMVEQLREQNLRLSAQVETLSAEKESMGRQTVVLQAQIRDLQQEKTALAATASKPAAEPTQGTESNPTQQAAIIAALQRDNLRLNDEVKRSTRELLSLNQQLRTLRSQPPKPAPNDVPGEIQAGTEQFQRQLATAQSEKADLEKWSGSLEKTLNEKTSALALAEANSAELKQRLAQAEQQVAAASRRHTDPTALANLERQLAEARQSLEKSETTVGRLSAANTRLESDMAALKRGSVDTDALLATTEQLTRENSGLKASVESSRKELSRAQVHVSELEQKLAESITAHTRGAEAAQKLPDELAEANRSVEQLSATVAELTAANQKLEQDLDNAQKSTAAALAAQSQAVSAASPDAFQMEISTLNARAKQLEGQVEEERASAAREIATLATQMQRLRETNKSLTDANRALLSAKENDTTATKDDIAHLQGKVRELTTSSQKQTSDLRNLTAERDGLLSQLADARKVATVLPGLTDEKAALQERLETVGSQLLLLQRDQEELLKANADLTRQLADSQTAAEKSQAELLAIQGKAAEAERASESHTTSVAELTQANTRLELKQEDMRRLVESYRADITRLTQSVRLAEQQKTEAERSSQQSIDAVTAQMGQLRRELDSTRTAQARLTENYAGQDRERSALIAQLRSENSALAARLSQAQSTLDQIASAARLGTPASTIASGGPAPTRPPAAVAAPVADTRFHTVIDGDTLSRISLRYYGTSNRWQDIFQANRDILQGSSALRVGMQLRIP